MQFIAKTFHGLEEVLMQELQALGAKNLQRLNRAVQFEGNRALLYKANLQLRTALRILMPIHSFRARSEDQLYREIQKVNWQNWMDVNDTLAIDAVTRSEVFRHSKYAALKTKDAIVDQFRRREGKRPDVDVLTPTLRINLHINDMNCSVSLDSSGESLHKRGYRRDALEAPLNEVLAAGMILLSGWDAKTDFLDPMCGSGTIPIEAAMIATNRPAQLFRTQFGFQRWKDFDKKLWEKILHSAKAEIKPLAGKVMGFDKDFRAVNTAAINSMAAEMDDIIIFERKKFEKLEKPGQTGLIVTNPPYDERLKTRDIGDLYKKIGDRLKQAFTGWEAWIITSNMEAMKNFSLHPTKKLMLYNGALECRFMQFEIFEGKRKDYLADSD